MTLPASSVISAVRLSHSIWSNGLTLASLNTRSMRSDFLASDLVGFMERVAETLLERRPAAFGAGDETSSRASIMVIYRLII
jgi:hypothetical protein